MESGEGKHVRLDSTGTCCEAKACASDVQVLWVRAQTTHG